LKVHPDKNSGAEATENFQKLTDAYKILSDPEKRALYDKTGDIEGFSSDTSLFQKALAYYRSIYKEVTSEDIEAFEKTYVGSKDEETDLKEYIVRMEGDMRQILEQIPLSKNSDVPRFVTFFEGLIKSAGKNPPEWKAKFIATKGKVKKLREEKPSKKDKGLDDLTNQIMKRKNQGNQENFFDHLEAVYGKPKKGKVKKNA
jgi:DnaJ homolog subfamily C member 9